MESPPPSLTDQWFHDAPSKLKLERIFKYPFLANPGVRESQTETQGGLQSAANAREITREQISQITSALSSAPRGEVDFDWYISDPETRQYKEQLYDLFSQLGYEVTNRMEIMMAAPPPVGLGIGIEATNKYPPEAIFIQRAFDAAGISLPGFIDPKATNEVIIFVGVKPEK
jgi:hypothetical protein